MALQDDWLDYVRDPGLFEDEYFAPLITDTEDPIDLDVAFGKLVNGRELISRIRRVIDENAFTGLYYVPKHENRLSNSALLSLGQDYVDSVASRLVSIHEAENATLLRTNPVEVISKEKRDIIERNSQIKKTDIFSIISGDFVDIADGRGIPYYYGLKEAVLFMTKIPEVTRYILDPLVQYPVNDELAYELWKGGARINFFDKCTYITID